MLVVNTSNYKYWNFGFLKKLLIGTDGLPLSHDKTICLNLFRRFQLNFRQSLTVA